MLAYSYVAITGYITCLVDVEETDNNLLQNFTRNRLQLEEFSSYKSHHRI